jgi:hypothetical protein
MTTEILSLTKSLTKSRQWTTALTIHHCSFSAWHLRILPALIFSEAVLCLTQGCYTVNGLLQLPVFTSNHNLLLPSQRQTAACVAVVQHYQEMHQVLLMALCVSVVYKMRNTNKVWQSTAWEIILFHLQRPRQTVKQQLATIHRCCLISVWYIKILFIGCDSRMQYNNKLMFLWLMTLCLFLF